MASRELARVIPLNSIWPVGFAFQALWTPLFVRQNYVDHGQVDIHLVFYTSFGLLSLLVALVFLAGKIRNFKVPYLTMSGISMLCKVGASVALTLEVFAGWETLAFTGAVVGAVGVVMSFLVWGSFFRRLSLKQAIAYILLAYMLVFFLQPLCYLLFPAGALLILATFALLGPLCLILSHQSIPEKKPETRKKIQETVSPISEQEKAPATLLKKKSFSGLLVAFAVYSFVLTLRSPASLSSDNLALIILYSIALLLTIAIYWRMIVVQAPLTFERTTQFLLAVFAVGFFLQSFSLEIFSEVPPALFMVATALIFMLAWMAVVDVTRSTSFHPFTIVGIWGACYGCPRLLYYALNFLIPLQNRNTEVTMMVSLIALFALCVVLFFFSQHSSGAPSFFIGLDEASSGAAEDEDQPCSQWHRIAQEQGLTERECEVFYLACEGYSRRSIAEHLCISENTVKAHLKRIYTKMDIHSKYDLEKLARSEQVK